MNEAARARDARASLAVRQETPAEPSRTLPGATEMVETDPIAVAYANEEALSATHSAGLRWPLTLPGFAARPPARPARGGCSRSAKFGPKRTQAHVPNARPSLKQSRGALGRLCRRTGLHLRERVLASHSAVASHSAGGSIGRCGFTPRPTPPSSCE